MSKSRRLKGERPGENRYYRRLRRKIDRHLALRRRIELYRLSDEPFSREKIAGTGEHDPEELDGMEAVYRLISEQGGMLMYPDGIEEEEVLWSGEATLRDLLSDTGLHVEDMIDALNGLNEIGLVIPIGDAPTRVDEPFPVVMFNAMPEQLELWERFPLDQEERELNERILAMYGDEG